MTVVRNKNGWPINELSEFTNEELELEASGWSGLRYRFGTVGYSQFHKYNDELKMRGIEKDWSSYEVSDL